MAHIHTNHGEHDHTISAFIVNILAPNNPKIMLHMHKKLGMLMQFGGHIELSETPWGALSHELQEESGYKLEELLVLQPYNHNNIDDNGCVYHPIPTSYITHRFFKDDSHYHTDISYVMVAKRKPSRKPQEGESDDIRYLTIDDINNLDDNSIFSNVKALSIEAINLVKNKQAHMVLIPASDFSTENPE